MVEILKQGQYVPMRVEEQVVIIFAASKGVLDDIELGDVRKFEEELMEALKTSYSDILTEILSQGSISKELDGKLTDAMNNFKKGFVA
jgi:F-type H+-transporting ATPase subunit alpha